MFRTKASALFAVAALLACLTAVAHRAVAAKGPCMATTCRPQSAACNRGFKTQFQQAKSDCTQLTGAARRSCNRAALRTFTQKKLTCSRAFKVCSTCCGSADTSACTAAVCGDGVVGGNEDCEPPGTASCDSACRVIVPTTTTSTSTSTTSTSTTTTTIPSADTGVSVWIAPPPNGTHFLAGDAPTVYVVLKDDSGNPLSLADLSTANLYMYGPQEETLTTTAAALLGASTDRNASVHHYINLKTDSHVVASGNVLAFPLHAITSELPGTYTASVWAVLSADHLKQWMPLADCQIGSATAETQIVEKDNCAACHLGATSGKFYMHHIDPGFSPTGNWALDSWPVRNCKACHNQNGYAAYTNGAGGSDKNVSSSADPIVRRVHGVHRGKELLAPFNTDPTTGDFRSYTDLEFPQDLKNCAVCHTDARWNTAPSRQACGACHDNIWFGASGSTPAGWTNHPDPGGQQNDDTACVVCHTHDARHTTTDIVYNHTPDPSPLDLVDVSMTAPANGTHYVAGETPLVTIVIRDDNGDPIDHTVVNSTNFGTAGLMVSGPRSHTLPVLTNKALYGNGKVRASATNNTAGPWTFNGTTDTFKIAVNGDSPLTLTPSGSMTPAQMKTFLIAQLAGVTGGVTVTSSASTNKVTIKSNVQGATSRIDIYNSPVTTIMGWKPTPPSDVTGITLIDPYPFIAQSSYPVNDLRDLNVTGWDGFDYVDPNVTRTTAHITYQLLDVAGLTPGTYSVYVWSRPNAGKVANLSKVGIAFLNFQVGTATAEPKIATNCTNCHADTLMHNPLTDVNGPHAAQFDTDYCKSCHDYSHYATGDGFENQGGTSTSGWSGFGAVPISRRVHGVHRGHYLDHPEQIYSNGDASGTFAAIIFPQDIRNCTTCHADSTTWTEKPSRLACLACHDSDAAKAHGESMTSIPDPTDPYGPQSVEACDVCHGKDKPWTPAIVHNISDPYAPPYSR